MGYPVAPQRPCTTYSCQQASRLFPAESSDQAVLLHHANPLLLLGMVNMQDASEADVPRGRHYIHLIVAAGYLPAVRGDIPIGQRTRHSLRIQRHADLSGLIWLHLDLGPAHQPFGRLVCARGQSEVNLRDLSTRTRTSIRDRTAHSYSPGAVARLGFHLELGVGEARIGESVPEREEWLDSQLVVAPVANTEAFTQGGHAAASPSILPRRGDPGFSVAPWVGDRQLHPPGD